MSMIYINSNVDRYSYPKMETYEVEKLITNYVDEPLYITFYARKEEFKPWVSRKGEKSYLRVILPYEEVLENEDNVPLLLTHLARNVERLKWLDHAALKRRIERLLERGIRIFSRVGFQVSASGGEPIPFEYNLRFAVETCEAFDELLPFNCGFKHVETSRPELWTENAPVLDILQQYSTAYAEAGEVLLGPVGPLRNRISGSLRIFYGKGQSLDAGNVFARVFKGELDKLAALGNRIRKEGSVELSFEQLEIGVK